MLPTLKPDVPVPAATTVIPVNSAVASSAVARPAVVDHTPHSPVLPQSLEDVPATLPVVAVAAAPHLSPPAQGIRPD